MKHQLDERTFTCVNLIFAVRCYPVRSHRHEATPRSLQSIDDRYRSVHNGTGHYPKHKLWWRAHNLQKKQEYIVWTNWLTDIMHSGCCYTINWCIWKVSVVDLDVTIPLICLSRYQRGYRNGQALIAFLHHCCSYKSIQIHTNTQKSWIITNCMWGPL